MRTKNLELKIKPCVKRTCKGKAKSCNITGAKGGKDFKQNVFRPKCRNALKENRTLQRGWLFSGLLLYLCFCGMCLLL